MRRLALLALAASCLARRPEPYDESAACRPHCGSDQRLHVISFTTPHFANITALFYRSLHAVADRDRRLTEYVFHAKHSPMRGRSGSGLFGDGVYSGAMFERAIFLRDLAKRLPDGELCVFLDADVVALRPLSELVAAAGALADAGANATTFTFMRNAWYGPTSNKPHAANLGAYVWRHSAAARRHFEWMHNAVVVGGQWNDQYLLPKVMARDWPAASLRAAHFAPETAAFSPNDVCQRTVVYHAIGVKGELAKLVRLERASARRNARCVGVG